MNKTIESDFAEWQEQDELFNSDIKLYITQGGDLKFEGKGTYDKKPQAVENESGDVFYQGHKSILTLSMTKLDFMDSYFDLKGYFVEITDNVGMKSYLIVGSSYNSNVNAIYCELKEA